MSKRDENRALLHFAARSRSISPTLVGSLRSGSRSIRRHSRLALLHITSISCQSHCHSVLAPEIKAEFRFEKKKTERNIYLSLYRPGGEIKVAMALHYRAANRKLGIKTVAYVVSLTCFIAITLAPFSHLCGCFTNVT